MALEPTLKLDRSSPVVLIWPSIGVIRSLGRLGVPVYCVGAKGDTPATASRYCSGTFTWDLRAADPERSVAFLGKVAEKVGGSPILVAADDHGALFVAEHSAALRAWYRMEHPSAELAHAVSDKQSMFHLCRRRGFPTPDALFPRSREEVEAALPEIRFPVVLKGIDTQLQERRSGTRMAIVHDATELLTSYEQMERPEAPNLMLQEYIPGGPDSVWMFNGYFDRDSRCLIGFTGRKLRQWPVSTGATSIGLCVRNEAVERRVIEFMSAIGYRGPLDLGLRYDARDGEYKLLDINPRIGATFRLFVGDNDMDVIRALHLDLTGREVTAGTYRNGRKWIDEYADLASSFRSIRDRELRLGDWLRSFRGIQEGQWLARDDIAPFARMAFGFASDALRRRPLTPPGATHSHNGNGNGNGAVTADRLTRAG
jgi:predicted ATP-grasp superfamily ATP-dependent carboligase